MIIVYRVPMLSLKGEFAKYFFSQTYCRLIQIICQRKICNLKPSVMITVPMEFLRRQRCVQFCQLRLRQMSDNHWCPAFLNFSQPPSSPHHGKDEKVRAIWHP